MSIVTECPCCHGRRALALHNCYGDFQYDAECTHCMGAGTVPTELPIERVPHRHNLAVPAGLRTTELTMAQKRRHLIEQGLPPERVDQILAELYPW